jgi:phosphopantothenoylcysteine decarboxylase/phosphopantothenate--cysteine ligase
MGFAVASAARRAGAFVTLIAGPTQVQPPSVDELVRIRTAAEMHAAVMHAADKADVVVMAAAVADYTPAERSPEKIAKQDGPFTLTLTRTPDILFELGRLPRRLSSGLPVLAGFAAETENVVATARAKRARKNVDLIIANDVSRADAGFDAETNAVTIIAADGEETVPLQSKDRVAALIVERIKRALTRTSLSSHA